MCKNFSDLIGRAECNLIVNFSHSLGKRNFEAQKNFNANIALVAF